MGNYIALTIGNIKAASLGVVFTIGIVSLVVGACLTLIKKKETAEA
jgi:hypothetical protein